MEHIVVERFSLCPLPVPQEDSLWYVVSGIGLLSLVEKALLSGWALSHPH